MAPVFLIAIQTRHPSLTPDQYRNHYDNIHIPLLKSLVGDLFPTTHSRYYFKRSSGAPEFNPIVFMGSMGGRNVDSVAVVEFQDEGHFKKFNEKMSEKEVYDKIAEDMVKFWKEDGVFSVFVEKPSVTRR